MREADWRKQQGTLLYEVSPAIFMCEEAQYQKRYVFIVFAGTVILATFPSMRTA